MSLALRRPYLMNPRSAAMPAVVGRAALVLLLWVPVVSLPWAVLDAYARLCEAVPVAPEIGRAAAAAPSGLQILSAEGVRLGDAPPAPRWLPMAEIPALTVAAFVAAEDSHFFSHRGIEPAAIARAMVANWQRQHSAQGGSTITQQLAKSFVGSEKTLERKLLEAVMARRLEQRYSKAQILEAYLNRIYLGAGATGIAAAAQIYFGVAPSQLDLAQTALLAGLAVAPSRLNPRRNLAAARERQRYVLQRMVALNLVSREAADSAREAPLVFAAPTPSLAARGYAQDEIRRNFADLPPEQRQDAASLLTYLSLPMQLHGESVVRSAARALAGRRGDPMRLLHLRPDEVDFFSEEAAAIYGAERAVGRSYAALVRARRPEGDLVELDSGGVTLWARAADAAALAPADVVQVVVLTPPLRPLLPALASVQAAPGVQGALVALDVDSGALRAMVGGVGYDETQFNRAARGCRQPGSVFKPLVYAKGLEGPWTVISPIEDVPQRYETPDGRLIWEPRNADFAFKGLLTLTEAFALSRNVPAVKVMDGVGPQALVAHARRLGIRSHLHPTPALALGASCVSPLEMSAAIGVYARGGEERPPTFLRSVLAADGSVLYDHGNPLGLYDGWDARLYRLVRALTTPAGEPAVPATTAYLVSYLMRQVVLQGTAGAARALPFPVAGKTGTTNRYDVWFIGYSADLLAGVWLGDDLNRHDLGESESGGTSALPPWMAFMVQAVGSRAQAALLPEAPEGIEMHRIDVETGQLAHAQGRGAWVPFRRGTAPQRTAPSPRERSARAADILDRDF